MLLTRKSRLNIEDVIGEYVALKRAGRNFKGLSPFTNEKTASFVVSPEKQIWKDFSSGKGGSMFDFVMEVEGLDFKGALELLARKSGVDLDSYNIKVQPLVRYKSASISC
jgi:DNA primase